MEEEIVFKAVAVGDVDSNSIIISVVNGRLSEDDIEDNRRQAIRLAEQLALWLTPTTTRAVRAHLVKMQY